MKITHNPRRKGISVLSREPTLNRIKSVYLPFVILSKIKLTDLHLLHKTCYQFSPCWLSVRGDISYLLCPMSMTAIRRIDIFKLLGTQINLQKKACKYHGLHSFHGICLTSMNTNNPITYLSSCVTDRRVSYGVTSSDATWQLRGNLGSRRKKKKTQMRLQYPFKR